MLIFRMATGRAVATFLCAGALLVSACQPPRAASKPGIDPADAAARTSTGDNVRPAEVTSPVPDWTAIVGQVWQTLEDGFYDPTFNGQDWQALRGPLLERASRIEREDQLVALVTELLRGLGSSHVGFGADPARASASVPTARTPGPASSPLEWRALDEHTGYIQIRHFMVMGAGVQAAALSLDSAFTVLRGLPALIIDLRGNPGGTLDLAALLAERLVAAPLPAGAFVTQAGLRSRGLSSVRQLDLDRLPLLPVGDSVHGGTLYQMIAARGGAAMLVAGGGQSPYRGRIAVLIDGRTASAAEAFAAALSELNCVLVAGEKSAGAMLSATSVRIEPGWQLRFPAMDFVTPGGRRLEGAGLEPALPVAGDNVIGQVREALRSRSAEADCM